MTEEERIDMIARLATQLEINPQVRLAVDRVRRGTARQEAWQVAGALDDIIASALRIERVLIPAIVRTTPSDVEAQDAFHEIGEELRHILYHILDTKTFDYVVPPADNDATGRVGVPNQDRDAGGFG